MTHDTFWPRSCRPTPLAKQRGLLTKWKTLKSRSQKERFDTICHDIVQAITDVATPCYLLPSLLTLLDAVNALALLDGPLKWTNIEKWIQRNCAQETMQEVCWRITGKKIPRQDYQKFFPIGLKKYYRGPHIVTAHDAPDLDTAVASFLGWMDALSCRISHDAHLWNVPSGRLAPQDQKLFLKGLSPNTFALLAQPNTTLTLNAHHLAQTSGWVTLSPDAPLPVEEEVAICIDASGYYLGAWTKDCAIPVRDAIVAIETFMQQFEEHLHQTLLAFLLQPTHWKKTLDTLFATPVEQVLSQCASHQQHILRKILTKLLHLEPTTTIQSLWDALPFYQKRRKNLYRSLPSSWIQQETLTVATPTLIEWLAKRHAERQEAQQALSSSIRRMRFVCALNKHVLTHPPVTLSTRAPLSEIKRAFEKTTLVIVLYQEHVTGSDIPVGVIPAHTLNETTLGTVTLRDFSNTREVQLANYLTVISSLDHHASDLKTHVQSTLQVGDVQSSNTLIAQHYLTTYANYEASAHSFIDPARIYHDCFLMLVAIFDDTDALTKLTHHDGCTVVALLHKLCSLQGKTCTLSLDALDPYSTNYLDMMRTTILNAKEAAFYLNTIDKEKQQALIDQLATLDTESLFSDTKTLATINRVGQTKLYASIIEHFFQQEEILRRTWLQETARYATTHPDIRLYLHMISTLKDRRSAKRPLSHKDQLWMWIPDENDATINALEEFLFKLKTNPEVPVDSFSMRVPKNISQKIINLYKKNLEFVTIVAEPNLVEKGFWTVFEFTACTMNSRKGIIAPCLPNPLAR